MSDSASCTVHVLDLRAMALDGLHLIEASAGTGKTYAISHLFLRLVLERERRVEQILVLTFTEAATEELRERIALRLREARAAFATGAPATGDPLLAGLVGRCQDRSRARALLDAALAAMDRAAIRTIHGFCHSLLRDFAFECGIPFDIELLTDEKSLRQRVAADVWRRRLDCVGPAEASWILTLLPQGPEALLKRLDGYLGATPTRILPEAPHAWRPDWDNACRIVQELEACWPKARAEVEQLFSSGVLKGNIYTAKGINTSLEWMDDLVSSGVPPKVSACGKKASKEFERFTAEKLNNSLKKGQELKPGPEARRVFELCDALAALDPADLLRRFRVALLSEALDAMRAELSTRKTEQRVLAFDDLLTKVDEALDTARGEQLAARIRDTYRHALIDEFQDTDSLQYRIFSRIYIDALSTGCTESTGLFLIGDPKQAIYAFRGADIFTYMAARRTALKLGQLHGMDTNWRSASALVETVNQIFGRARAPFIFEDDIQFDPVNPGPKADEELFLLDGNPAPGLLWRWLALSADNQSKDGQRILVDPARTQAAEDCAAEIAALLAAASQQRAHLGARALRASDIAVLVRSHAQGHLVRDALARHAIACVSLGRETVFESDEAEELALVLAALRLGAEESVLRRALATRLLGWSAHELAGLEDDEQRWSALLMRFDDYRTRWNTHGCLSALEALVHGERIAARLRAAPDGERRLTNLLHLIELAQEVSGQYPGIEGLERWLADQRHEAGSGDGALLRLESDEALVRILTIHKSKGLEFPLVFLPFMSSVKGGSVNADDAFIFHDRAQLDRCLDLGTSEQERARNLALLREEALAEDLRLFYVAITRAKQRCVIHWGAVNGAEQTGAAYLLHQDALGRLDHLGSQDETAWRADLERLVDTCSDAMCLELVTPDTAMPVSHPPPASSPLRARQFQGHTYDTWRVLSYSGLIANRVADPERPDHDALSTVIPASEAEQRTQPEDPVFEFPRGARAGECLHDLFEHLDFANATEEVCQSAAESVLTRHGIDTPLWSKTLADWSGRVLETPLNDSGLRLSQLKSDARRAELEFHFTLDHFQTDELRKILRQHKYPDPGLEKQRWQGFMKGYIDLVFRHDGRYYILDYKSNHLGNHFADYQRPQLDQAMRAHHYHLQYLIYLLALHRYLRWRLPGYDYERHIGGVYYLFLRGMHPDHKPPRGVYYDRPSLALIEALDHCFGHVAKEGAA